MGKIKEQELADKMIKEMQEAQCSHEQMLRILKLSMQKFKQMKSQRKVN